MAKAAAIDYETTVFTLPSDHLGPNKATLLHARAANNTHSRFYKAVVYLHGYIDYYFHDHVCQRFLDHGYDFYALDMRKCGRSIIVPAQDHHKHYCSDLHEYDEEITLSIEHLRQQGNGKDTKILLLGHSTGGLIASLYASSGSRRSDIDAVILNSPYLSPMKTTRLESVLLRVLMKLRRSQTINANWYGHSIHSSGKGEWDFDLAKKPIDRVPLHGTFLSAVAVVQDDIAQQRICVSCPVLFMCSNRSIKPDKAWRDEYAEADLILDVETMKRAAGMLGPQVSIHEIENAKHDVFLSKEAVREKALGLMFGWLKEVEESWVTKPSVEEE